MGEARSGNSRGLSGWGRYVVERMGGLSGSPQTELRYSQPTTSAVWLSELATWKELRASPGSSFPLWGNHWVLRAKTWVTDRWRWPEKGFPPITFGDAHDFSFLWPPQTGWLKAVRGITSLMVLEARGPNSSRSRAISLRGLSGSIYFLPLSACGGSRHPLACGCVTPTSASAVTLPPSLLSTLLRGHLSLHLRLLG